MGYRVVVRAREVRSRCAAGYQPGDTFTIEKRAPHKRLYLQRPSSRARRLQRSETGEKERAGARGAPIRETEGRWRSG
jgi:hypothetical protein